MHVFALCRSAHVMCACYVDMQCVCVHVSGYVVNGFRACSMCYFIYSIGCDFIHSI